METVWPYDGFLHVLLLSRLTFWSVILYFVTLSDTHLLMQNILKFQRGGFKNVLHQKMRIWGGEKYKITVGSQGILTGFHVKISFCEYALHYYVLPGYVLRQWNIQRKINLFFLSHQISYSSFLHITQPLHSPMGNLASWSSSNFCRKSKTETHQSFNVNFSYYFVLL